MTQALNYSIRAIEEFSSLESPMPLSAIGFRYLADKLREAQVFILPDHGELLDRGKAWAEVPNIMLRPPFPVVALEYQSPAATGRFTPGYTDAISSRRISLAWDWQGDLPRGLRAMAPTGLGPGVAIASIYWSDDNKMWLPVAAAMHIAYDEPWEKFEPNQFTEASVASGRMTQKQAAAKSPRMSPIPLLPEALYAMVQGMGGETMLDHLAADSCDEVGAYFDLCFALACKNVSTERHDAPERLNRQRIKAGRLPLVGFHVLKLNGEPASGAGGLVGPRHAPRSHLRRGHIRRLSADRLTWVNQTIVRGRGFVDKAYAL